jgi:hypothetical protein
MVSHATIGHLYSLEGPRRDRIFGGKKIDLIILAGATKIEKRYRGIE